MEREATPARAAAAAVSSAKPIKHLRWYICGLLFFATVVNYIDRQVLGTLAPELQTKIGWTESEYSQIVIWFQIAYAVMFLVWGGVLDRIGVKLGFIIALIVWSLAGMGHALATTAVGFMIARFFLGIGEAANFPASVKTIGEWFPKRERALATGIFNAGTNVGAILAPITALVLSARFGWQSAFLFTGAVGFVWLIFWWWLYQSPEQHPRLSAEEFKTIRDGETVETTEKVSWWRLLGLRQTWAFSVGKMLTDPVWWFYLFWMAKFLGKNYGVKGTALIPYLTTVYLIADVGSVGGGWLSSWLIRRGWTVNWARKTAMLLFAAIMPMVIVAYYAKSPWTAAILVGIAAGAHQGWSANLFTLTNDMFPRKAVGSVVGIGSFAGAVGGIFLPLYAGKVLDKNPSYYLPMFLIAGLTYLVAWVLVHLLVPKMEPADPADLDQPSSFDLSPRWGLAGGVIGGLIGFLLRPSASLMGQLPFETVITRGANLQGLEQVLVPIAQTSFNYLLAGLLVGAVIGLVVGHFARNRRN